MFGFSKPKTFPRLTPEMIQPPGHTPNPTEAKKLYTEFMAAIGFHSKQELALHSRYFIEDLKEHERRLREEIADTKSDIKDAKTNLKECRTELKAAQTDKEREWAEDAIARAEAKLTELEISLANGLSNHEEFKADKRPFLVAYVNREIFGDEPSQA